MFDYNNTKTLHLETSSVCNAACPMCPRELDKSFNKDTDAVSLTAVSYTHLTLPTKA